MRRDHVIWMRIGFLGYVIFTALAVWHHEPWRDEAQAWLIARDVPLYAFFSQANYEGTPFFWHLLLLPFAKTGSPMLVMHGIHLLIAYGIVYLFLFKSRFSLLTKLLFLFSYYMFWEYAILARNYSLSILLLWSIAILYEQRHQKSLLYAGLIFLLFNTNVHSIPIALGLSGSFLYELKAQKAFVRRSQIDLLSGLFLVVGLFLALWQLWPAPDNINAGLVSIFNWKRPFIALSNAFLPNVPQFAYLPLMVSASLLALLGTSIFQKDSKVGYILIIGVLGLAYIFTFKHVGSLRHHGLLLMLLLFAMWISNSEQGEKQFKLQWMGVAGLNLCLAISIFFSIQHHIKEFQYPFSGAQAASEFLNAMPLEDNIIIAHPSIKASAMVPYLKTDALWYADVADFDTYITWNTEYEKSKEIPFAEVKRRAEAAFGDKEKEILYILDQAIPAEFKLQFELIFESRKEVFGYGDERYYVYKQLETSN